MIVNVKQTLKQLNGKDLLDVTPDGTTTTATIDNVMVNAILAPTQNETGVEKVKKFELAKRIFNADEEGVDLNEEEIKLIKEAVGKNYSPLVVGQIYELLKV